jgi:hypothetical protein
MLADFFCGLWGDMLWECDSCDIVVLVTSRIAMSAMILERSPFDIDLLKRAIAVCGIFKSCLI